MDFASKVALPRDWKPLARYRTTFSSARSAEDTFGYLADFSHSPEWDPSVVTATRLDAGPLATGSRFLIVTTFVRQRVPLEYEITRCEPSRHVEFCAERPHFRSIDHVTVEPAGAGAVVTYDARLSMLGVGRLVDPIFALLFRRSGRRAREGLTRELGR